MLVAASLMSLLFRKNSSVLLLGIDTGGVVVFRLSDEDFSGLSLLFRIAVSILTSEFRILMSWSHRFVCDVTSLLLHSSPTI